TVYRGGSDHRPAGLCRQCGIREVPAARGVDRMNPLLALPPWAALTVALLALASALLTLIGCIGLLRLKQFYQRVHAPTLGTTLGLYLMLAATILFFCLDQGRPVLHVLLIAACVIVTTPI